MAGGGTSQQSQNQNTYYSPAKWAVEAGQNMGQQAAGGFKDYFNTALGVGNAGAGAMGDAANWMKDAGTFSQDKFQNQFLNPYTKDVVENMSTIGNRNFNQQAAPALQGALGASGQFGSGRGMAAMQQASRDNQMNILTNQQQAMTQGYQNSMQNYLSSMGIGVQGASNLGQLGLGAMGMPGSIFGQFAQGLSQLPMVQGQTSQQTGITGQQLG